ncbi:hypothetical protein QTN25_010590 [Entamoeba marina]
MSNEARLDSITLKCGEKNLYIIGETSEIDNCCKYLDTIVKTHVTEEIMLETIRKTGCKCDYVTTEEYEQIRKYNL